MVHGELVLASRRSMRVRVEGGFPNLIGQRTDCRERVVADDVELAAVDAAKD